MKQFTKGFTLIEMLIVVAVIAILAGVVLTGVSGFQASARDTKRIGDLRNAQNFLELYFNRCGHYPGSQSTTICPSATDWDALEIMMEAEGFTSNFPNDPIEGRSYLYGAEDPENLRYVIGATLERANNALNDDVDIAPFSTIDCSDTNLNYCIQS